MGPVSVDTVWLTPETLLWPLYGFSFSRIDVNSWIQHMFYILLNESIVDIPEITGAEIVIKNISYLVG